MLNKKFFLTKEGLARIKDEYQELKRLKLSRISSESPRILHSEDINPEFLAFQEDLELLDTRIVELENILKNVQPITAPPKEKRGVIDLGAQVQVEVDGQIDEFTIVGTSETNPDIGKVSNESPIGKALLGHKIGEEVVIGSPAKVTYKIVKIRYPSL
ncbi:MAG: GreA/GreB family elongation factor [bacterium]|nr:GreA/GreB family elongation factor [bacterium]